MVIISSYQENKENCQPNELSDKSNEISFDYKQKFNTSVKILFNILNNFFPKTNFKELDNSIKKVFNLVVKTPTEFNKKPLDDLYQKLDKVYNRINDNDVSMISLNSMRSFSLEGMASPKMNEFNSNSFKFNH